jgi:hypothetical protein
MNYLVIYPGRFHPFHKGHMASYDWLTKQFGDNNVFVATSNVQAPITSPFSYSDKVAMMTKLGIPASRIANVKNPYQAIEITSSIPDENQRDTVLVFAVSAKDAERFNFAPKKDGSLSYLQPLPKNAKKLKPMTQHGYVVITPTINFKINGVDANSASEIRKLYIKGNDHDKNQIIADLYGQPDPALRDIFDKKLGITEQTQNYIRESRAVDKARAVDWMQRVLVLEQQAQSYTQPTQLILTQLTVDYIDEKNYGRN